MKGAIRPVSLRHALAPNGEARHLRRASLCFRLEWLNVRSPRRGGTHGQYSPNCDCFDVFRWIRIGIRKNSSCLHLQLRERTGASALHERDRYQTNLFADDLSDRAASRPPD